MATYEKAMAHRLLRRAKILLKIGDLKRAREATEEYSKMVQNLKLPTTALTEMRALLLTAESQFKDAMEILIPLVQMTGANRGGGVASADVVNNFAVCALFTNQITLALDTMEMAVRADPFQCLNLGMVQNLVALYDLCSMKDQKALLRKLVDRYAADDVAEGCRRNNLW
uniref:Coatomer subunit epsilon n=1 Tax=Lotharella oceanica TaxID=641309 RepID=A0A7S2TJY5_9EUKA|mmetsp:Transcript_15025/g.28586  ORF Transcript_15025/g.28586 Transcript_15025/m.28586 type:complete len:170 (+) Transcript_15025:810-1319(+)